MERYYKYIPQKVNVNISLCSPVQERARLRRLIVHVRLCAHGPTAIKPARSGLRLLARLPLILLMLSGAILTR